MRTIGQSDIRRQNLEKMLTVLIRLKRATRQELSRETGLSLMSVSNLVTQLDGQGVLRFSPAPDAPGFEIVHATGRRAQLIELALEDAIWLALDLTGSRFRLYILRLDGTAVLPYWSHQSDMLEPLESELLTFLARAASEARIGTKRLMGIAAIIPGASSRENGASPDNRFTGINPARLAETLRRACAVRHALVDEDIRLSVRAFLPPGGAERDDLLQYLYISEGVSGVTAYQGEALHRRGESAGSLGQVMSETGRCYADELPLRALAHRVMGGECPSTGECALTNGIVSIALEMGSEFSAILANHARLLARLLHTVVCTINPTRIVIECRYASTLPHADEFKAATRAALADMLSGERRYSPDILFVNLAQPSALTGAARALTALWLDDVAAVPAAIETKPDNYDRSQY